MNQETEADRYRAACEKTFWQAVFAVELEYLLRYLRPEDAILSVGCGPATIEGALLDRGFSVVGLDVSAEALEGAPDGLRTVAARAEEMPFAAASFDVVIAIVSLQFIEDYPTAIAKIAQVLRPGGRVIIMLLNPRSRFFRSKQAEPDSYVRKIRHTNLAQLERELSGHFALEGEYFLGVDGTEIFPSQDPETAALYVLRGVRGGTSICAR
jgi:ubiquinone/menaquinone biosynthesis C-methylase UbiE